MCRRCGGPADGEYCADCERVRLALRGMNGPLVALMGWPKKHRCHYCPLVARTWDHVVPRSRGGPEDEANLVPACRRCNENKAGYRSWCDCAKCAAAWERWGGRAAHYVRRVKVGDMAGPGTVPS